MKKTARVTAPGAAPPATSRAATPAATTGGARWRRAVGWGAVDGVAGGEANAAAAAQPGTAEPVKALQMLDCYLVVDVPPDEALFLDQHALHERILFEQFRLRLRTGSLETQRRLTPEPVSLAPAQAAAVLEQREALAELGFAVDDFGGGTVLLSGYPALLGERRLQAVFQALVEHQVHREGAPSRDQLLHDLLSLMACHAAVRAGDRLTPQEITVLRAQRALAEDSHHCPHGRPTSLRFSRRDLERHFRRV